MDRSRRRFLVRSSASLLAAAAAPNLAAALEDPQQSSPPTAPGTPPAFGTAPAVGPEVSAATFGDAEKLVRVEMTPKDLAQAASNWRESMAPLYERRTGPRKTAIGPEIQPWSRVSAVAPGQTAGPAHDQFVRSTTDPGPLPEREEDIAYSPVWKLSRWIETRQITSERLTQIYLARLQRFDPNLHCVITLTARSRSRAGAPRRQGNRRRPLSRPAARHSVGRKGSARHRGHPHDLWCGALSQPHSRAQRCRRRSSQPGRSCARREAFARCAGAERHLVRRPDAESVDSRRRFLRLERRSRSCDRRRARRLCYRQRNRRQHRRPQHALRRHRPAPHLRPRPAHRSHGALLVARQARPHGARASRTPCSSSTPSPAPTQRRLQRPQPSRLRRKRIRRHGLRVGYFPEWMQEDPATDVDRAALKALAGLGMTPVEVSLPDWTYDCLDVILFAESPRPLKRSLSTTRSTS